MPTLRKSLLNFVFSGSNMRRWNDKLRPVELYEVDKQAHKMITAFFLYQLQCRDLDDEARLRLGRHVVEGGLFDYFYRLIITDIKPPIFYRIKENTDHYRQLTEWVLSEMEPVVRPLDEEFWQRLSAYHTRPFSGEGDEDPSQTLADRILQAAHLYSSKWEFGLIRPLNYFDEELRDIDSSFTEQLRAMDDLPGVRELAAASGNSLVRTANLCGQLRFQIRWSQTPRIPDTSVLGHMLIVATYAYFLSLSEGACTARCLNNFFSGLFHDLPELLTRDIITPVKRSTEHLPELIHEYEKEELERRVLVPLEVSGYRDIRDRLAYYLGWDVGSEFLETIRDDSGEIHPLSSYEELHLDCNQDRFDGKDGRMVKMCDILAAFIEAHTSVRNGVSSPELLEAVARIRAEYRHHTIGGFNVGTLLADFD